MDKREGNGKEKEEIKEAMGFQEIYVNAKDEITHEMQN